jgi:hypothetical protein
MRRSKVLTRVFKKYIAALYELSDEDLRRVKRSYGFESYTRPGGIRLRHTHGSHKVVDLSCRPARLRHIVAGKA